jgi:urea transport system permease protein
MKITRLWKSVLLPLSPAAGRLHACLLLVGVVLACLFPASQCRAADDAANQAPVPADLQAAIKSLEKFTGNDQPDIDGRQKVYDLISQKGDARLVPALQAYKDQKLEDLNGRLVFYDDPVLLPTGEKGFPILDAFTLHQLKNPDGSPMYLISRFMKAAPGGVMMRIPAVARHELTVVVPELISSLSLLDPDDEKRTASIDDVGDKANKALYSSAWSEALVKGLDADVVALKRQAAKPGSDLGKAAQSALDAIQAVKQEVASHSAAAERVSISPAAMSKLTGSLKEVQTAAAAAAAAAPATGPSTVPATTAPAPDADASQALAALLQPIDEYQGELEKQTKALADVRKFRPILAGQLAREKSSKFQRYLKTTIARLDLAIPTTEDKTAAAKIAADKIAAAKTLGDIGTSDGESTMEHALDNAILDKQSDVESALRAALAKESSYQTKVHFAENTFAGLSSASILVLLALGLSIIFGLMGVINMAHGEFMMVGAFATWGVSEWFKSHAPGAFDYYLIAAIPAAFLAAALVGYICEILVVKHLYGRPLDTLLATWGIGLILIWAARDQFGDNMHITPPRWLQGGLEVAPDLVLARNRLFIIGYCVFCVALVYFIVNRTKLGLLLRATTQSRQTAMSLGVATRRVDAFTFAVGAGLAGLAGVAVTMVDKINPNMGQDYIVESFNVVVVGGVGKLAGAMLAGLGLGMIAKYLEPILGSFKALASGAPVFTKVIVLCAIIAFLQRRPQGLFPPKGRLSDA